MTRCALWLGLCGLGVSAGARAEDARDPSVVREALEERSGVLDCYADELGRDPYVAGHASVTVTIGRGGEVESAVVDEQCVAAERFERCLERKLARVRFAPDAPRGTIRHDLLFNSGVIGHVIRGGEADVAMCAASAPPPPGGYFTLAWQVRAGEIVGAEVVDASFDATALSRCIHVRSEGWGWDFSKWTDGEVRYAFRFVEADVLVQTATVSAPSPVNEGTPRWGEVSAGVDVIRGNREVATLPISLSGGGRWGSNELFGEATGQPTGRWHAHVRYHRWLGARSALHVLAGARDDPFSGYDRRTQLLAGYSRWLVDGERVTVALDGGLEYAIEDYVPRVNKDWDDLFALRVGVPLSWRLSERITVYDTVAFYQNVRDTVDRRVHNGVALRVLVVRPVSLEVGHRLVYDRDPVKTTQGFDQAAAFAVVLHAGDPQPVRWLDPLP